MHPHNRGIHPMTSQPSRRQFLGSIACAFAAAAIPCNIPAELALAPIPKPEPLPPGLYNLIVESVDSGSDDRTIIMRFVNYQNSIVYGKFGQRMQS